MQKAQPKSSTKQIELIRKLVDRGYQLHLQVAALSDELKDIKDKLKAEALAYPKERTQLADPSSEGTQWIAPGTEAGCHIVFPAPRLVQEIAATHRDLATLRNLTQDKFRVLFRETVAYQPNEKSRFRQLIAETLEPGIAGQVLELCTTPSDPRTLWKPNKGTPTIKTELTS